MANPLILSTWSFGQRANAAAWPTLGSGGSSLDAVELACRDAEADPANHTVGYGGFPDRSGRVTLDASIMLSPAKSGAVASVRRFVHPISIARRVMERTPHALLAGEGADVFAQDQGFEPAELLSDAARGAWEKWRREQRDTASPVRNIEELGLGASDRAAAGGTRADAMQKSRGEGSHDTIGVLALDAGGTLAGGCTTSGLAFKLPGRVGDSPIIGHGLYVDPAAGAAVATGHGELVMGVCGSFLAVELLRRGAAPLEAAMEVLRRIASSYPLGGEDQVGVIVLKPNGAWSAAALRDGFRVAVRDRERDELVNPERVLLSDA